ncbi:MAG: hypothetical protein ACTSVC_16060, partial [Promethearchaeota archaeon]
MTTKESKKNAKVPKITAISDEFSQDLEEVLKYLKSRNVKFVELRDVWRKRIHKLPQSSLEEVKELLEKYGFKVSALGS